LTASTGKAGEKTLQTEDLVTTLPNIKSGWLDILNPGEAEKEFMLEKLNFHPLAVEDCFADPVDRAEHYETHRFVVLKARDADSELDTEYLLVFLTDNLLVTVRNTVIPAVERFRDRYRSIRRQKRLERGPEFLLYELLDSVADDWMDILSNYSDKLDNLEDRVFDPHNSYSNLLESLHQIKQDLREIQKSIIPLQNIVGRLMRPDEEFISEENYLYFRDLADVIKGLVIQVENYSSGAASTRDTYLSQVSVKLSESNSRLSEVMTTLTVIGSIMLPLSLIAGIAGMNVGSDFDFTQIVSVMIGFAGIMLFYFYRKGWIGPQK
jgi:magnesium transporter